MADVTVSQLAETVGTPVDRLLEQMKQAGLPHRLEGDQVAEDEKHVLLTHLKKSHGADETAPKKITLKRRTVSTLKAGGAAARGRTVNVEVRKKRTYVRRATAEAASSEPVAPEVAPEPETTPRFSDEEARRREAHAQAEAEAEAKRLEQARRVAELEAEKAKEEAERKAVEEAKKKPATAATESEEDKISARKDKRDRHDLDDDDKGASKQARHGKRKRLDYVEELLEVEVVEELVPATEPVEVVEPVVVVAEPTATLALSRTRPKRRAPRKVGPRQKFQAPTAPVTQEVELGESITISQLSQKLSIKANAVMKTLMDLGVMATINQSIDQETATLVVEEFGHKVKLIDTAAVETALQLDAEYNPEDAATRAPVVTVMGHVDHGKTSLLDYIRKAKVAEDEAGGITQHIGAYRVATDQGDICFIDTPGHAAFTAMRARGANCTDIVILVVAADDGVMPQTEEAIAHTKGAGATMVVAVNKMDTEGADLERVKSDLAAKDVIPEEWGGEIQFIPVSAMTGAGVDDLLEAVSLQAELLELNAVAKGPAQGVVLESRLDKGKGSVATLLVQNGTLAQGDIIVAGENYGRVRALTDINGERVTSIGPSTPVSVLGLDGTPGAGDPFTVAKDEKKAREVAEFRREKATSKRLGSPSANLDTFMQAFGSEEVSYLNIVVKADVRGSLEAIISSLEESGNEEVKVKVVFSGVGAITESDVNYAVTANAVVFGFNVRADNAAKKLIEREGIDLRYYKVIYDLVDDVKAALSGMLSPEVREEIIGIAQVREVFDSKKFGQIAGCMVTEGTVSRAKQIRVLRDHVVIFEGELESLRHFKDEVPDVRSGTECGIGVRNYNDVKTGDQIEVFDTREVERVL